MTPCRSTGFPLRLSAAAFVLAAAGFPVACGERPPARVGAEARAEAEPLEQATPPGLAIYQRACLSCHGPQGLGQAGLYPPLADVDWVQAPLPGRLIRIVLQGLAGPVTVNGQPFPTATPFMPGHAATLTDEEISTLLTWLRRSMGNDAPPVSAAQVAAIRAEAKDRTALWTAAELLSFPDH